MVLRDDFIDFAAGWAAGAASVLASQPLDVALTRLQVAHGGTATTSGLIRKVWTEGGAKAFWRGASPLIGLVPLQNSLLFMGYGAGERWSDSTKPMSSVLPVFFGGCIGGLAQSFVVAPMELLKVRLQVPCGSGTAVGVVAGNTTLGAAQQLYASIGVPALWRGLGATFARDVLPHGVWFASYEACKQGLLAHGFSKDTTTPLVAGSVAATVAWVVGYPFDLIKTRIQAASPTSGRAPTIFSTTRCMLNECDGNWRVAFYRGLSIKLLRAVPSNAITFFAYETAKTHISHVV